MTLRLPPPPPEGLEIINAALNGLLSTPTPALGLTEGVQSGATLNLEAAVPHLVYFVGLDDITTGKLFSVARPTGWRYLLLEDDTTRAAAELTINDDGGVEEFSYVDQGPFVESMVTAVAYAEELEANTGGDYELRLLSVPSLYLIALWLHGVEDLLVPLSPAPAGLDSDRAYTEDEMFSSLLELIERRVIGPDPIP